MKNRKLVSIILIVIGVLLIGCSLLWKGFHVSESIKTNMIEKNTTRVLKQKIVKPKKETSSQQQSPNDIKDVNISIAHSGKQAKNAIGIIKVMHNGQENIELPLFQNMNNQNMAAGACLMFSNRLPGSNNNVFIIGHHMENDNILFGKLPETTVNDKVLITTYDKTYEYVITGTKVVNEQDYGITQDTSSPTITLMTCASGQAGTPYRFIATGKLSQVLSK